MRIDEAGWLRHPGVRHAPTGHCDERPDPDDVSLLVVHNISLPPGVFGGPHIEALFTGTLDCDADPWFDRLRGLRVSAHFLIDRQGVVTQFVPTTLRAWHAGPSSFEGRERCNDFSIGVELEGADSLAYTDAQYDALVRLTGSLRARHPLAAVRGHEHIAPGRKTDPGAAFDWARYGRAARWPADQLPVFHDY